MKSYKIELKRIRYEQIEVMAKDENEAYLIAHQSKAHHCLLANERVEMLSIAELEVERRKSLRESEPEEKRAYL